jgi:polysaccharide pyruvyl transferase WcaK-like protein
LAASLSGGKAVYLPQSIGPLPPGGRAILRRIIGRIRTVYVRDDRSLDELRNLGNVRRAPDMAIWADLDLSDRSAGQQIDTRVILSTRYIRGRLPAPVKQLPRLLGDFDGYVQSTVGQNNDVDAVRDIGPRRVISAEQLLDPEGPRRVVVAMRLHAALMAINAGHYVIHLAYERKGFGAFGDLGLSEYVHRTSHFDPVLVAAQARTLLESADAREEYDRLVREHRSASVVEGGHVRHETAQIAGVA